MSFIKEKINTFFGKGNERTILAKKNIAISFIIKGGTILISVILVPLTIGYANPERNGIWLTIHSLVTWLYLFDIGLGNGMKNKVAEAKAAGNNELARKYISSTYAIVSIICLVVFALFLLINPHLDWMKILGAIPDIYADEVSGLVKIFIVFFCLNFVLNILKSVAAADQRPAIGSVMDLVGQIFVLIGIFILSKTTPPSLISLGLVTLFCPIAVSLGFTIYMFATRYKQWRPSFRYVNLGVGKSMMNLGIKFFIASIAALLITYTLPFFIQRAVGPTEVTYFNTTFRLFAILYNIMNIIIFPTWASFTDAYAKQDSVWMTKTVKAMYKLFIAYVILEVIILFLSPILYHIWINNWMESDNVLEISFSLSACVCVYTCVLCWLNMNIYPLNGIGKVKLQVYSSVLEIILFIPVAIFLGDLYGTIGIVIAPILVYIPRMIWAPIQLRKLINNKGKGIWNK
ncbi:O-antigen/teichoic acid export membrane protein [Dysgonomonadaceae bacterium PH5-43]|nr:O-antigen/teichoic acid export membrane protein [Dysgonomonadaceae bacterium PH5-43]